MADERNSDWPKIIFDRLVEAEVNLFAYVPDFGNDAIVKLADAHNETRSVLLSTEEEGVAMAAGAWLGGQKHVLLMQSSGAGNCVNMFSLLRLGRFPFVTILSMRGDFGEGNPWQMPMGASIEGRVPFLDHRIAEFAMSIHGEHKYGKQFENKLLLRKLAQRHLPLQVSSRKKHGFPNAVTKWLSPAAIPEVRQQLCDPGTFVATTFPKAWVAGLLQSEQSVRQHALTLHSLLVLSSWHRVFAATSHAPSQKAASSNG